MIAAMRVCCFLLLLTSTAFAQTPRALFDEGTALFNKGQFAKAAEKFEASYAARPVPATKYNIARAWEAAGQTLKAIDAYQSWRLMSPPGPESDEVAGFVKVLGAKLAKVGVQAVTITSLPMNARVTVDGVPRGVAPITLELTPTKHLVRLELEGRQAEERPVTLTLDQPVVLSFELPPVAGAPVPLPPPAAPEPTAMPLPAPPSVTAPMPLPRPTVPRATDDDFEFAAVAQDAVRVHITTDTPGVRLYRLGGNPNGECRAPCDAPISRASDTFGIGGDGLTASSAFVLADHQHNGRVSMKVKGGSAGVFFGAGTVLASLGIGFSVLGLVSLISSYGDRTLGLISLLGGLLAGGGSIVAFVTGSTSVDFENK